MRRSRVQFTVRRLLLAAAIVAAAMPMLVKPFLDQWRWSRRGQYHAGQANAYLTRAEAVETQDLKAYAGLLQRGKWHQSLAARYARAAYTGIPPSPEGSPPPDP
jgi:Tfp pilus assembly protein FimT